MRASWGPLVVGGAVVSLVALGCSSEDSAEPTSTPAPPTTSEASTTTDPTPTSTSTTEPPDATTVTSGPPSDPTTTEATPPSTAIPQAPAPIDPDDPNNQRTSLPEHEPILGAYRRAVEGELLTYSRWPLDPESPELVNGPFTARVMEPIRQGIADRTALNQVLDIGDGITLRPYVIEDDDGDPNRVFVWDCQIDATFWKDVDTGAKAPPDAFPNVGPPGVETGVVAVMVNVDGQWLLDEGATGAPGVRLRARRPVTLALVVCCAVPAHVAAAHPAVAGQASPRHRNLDRSRCTIETVQVACRPRRRSRTARRFVHRAGAIARRAPSRTTPITMTTDASTQTPLRSNASRCSGRSARRPNSHSIPSTGTKPQR